LRLAAVAVSTAPPKQPAGGAGDPARWGRILDVPACTQSYPDGGEGWCSPTSISMVVGYWAHDAGPCEPRVRAAVDGVYDWVYDGHGNWPFNTAYAAGRGLEAYVTRFRSLADAEPWIAAGLADALGALSHSSAGPRRRYGSDPTGVTGGSTGHSSATTSKSRVATMAGRAASRAA